MASPPQMPYDPRYYRYRRPRSMAGPIILVAVGVMLLLMNMRVMSWPSFAWFFSRWWPLLLIIFGVIRIAEYTIARSQGGAAPRLGGGGAFLLILFIVIGLSASSARHLPWQQFSDNIDVNPGWDGMFGEKYDFTQELSHPLPPDGRIQIDTDRGSVTVHVAENGDAPVKTVIHRHISADSQESANRFNDQQKPTMSVDGDILRINSGDHVAHVQVGFVMGPRIVTDVEIWAPRKAPVQVNAARGDINVSQRDADVKISTAHGDVQAEQIKGTVEITSQRGNVQLGQVSGDVHIQGRADDVTLSDISGVALLEGEFFGDTKLSHIGKSVKFHSTRTDMELGKLDGDLSMDSGDLRVSSVAGPFEVRTRAKDIRLEEVSGPITVENSHGEIDVRPKAPFGDVTLNNHQGAIHIVLPESAGFTVEARSTRGELESDFPLNVTKNGDDHVAEGSVGKGGKKVQLTTDHGTIEIRKG